MQSLKDVVAALRAEIEAGLALNQPLAQVARLEADRVIATLQFRIDEVPGEGNPVFTVLGNSAKPAKATISSSIHSLTIEFKPRIDPLTNSQENGAAQTSATPVSNAKPIQGAEAETLTKRLGALFGVPSFDSAARATVFCEALENLSVAETEGLVRALRGTSPGENETTVKRSLSLLNRVLKSGPAGLVEGKNILLELLSRYQAKAILQLVAAVWKTQQEWMD